MAAALGLGVEEGDSVISLGTSGTVYSVTPLGLQDASGAINGYADATGRFMPMVTTLNAAKVTDCVRGCLESPSRNLIVWPWSRERPTIPSFSSLILMAKEHRIFLRRPVDCSIFGPIPRGQRWLGRQLKACSAVCWTDWIC